MERARACPHGKWAPLQETVGTLVFAAVGVVVQLKDALNTVWDVKAPPGSGIWRFARTYIWSLFR
jgi:membrane protein